MNFIIAGVVVFFIFLIFSRRQNEKALNMLTMEQRGMLVTAYAKNRRYSIIILAVIMVAFLSVAYTRQVDKYAAMLVYFGALILYFVAMALLSLNKVKSLDLPEGFKSYNNQATWIRIAGLSVFIALMAIGLFLEFKKQG